MPSSLRIAVAGPIGSEYIQDLVSPGSGKLPVGYRGAPLLGTLIRELLAMGHQVGAFTTDNDLFSHGEPSVSAYGERFQITFVPSRRNGFRFERGCPGKMFDFFRLERRELTRALVEFRPDVVHAHWAYEFAWAAQSSGLPTLVTLHDSPGAVLNRTRDLYRSGRFLMGMCVLRRASMLTAVSPDLKSDVTPYARGRHIAVIANPVSNDILAQGGGPERDPNRILMVLNGFSEIKNAKAGLQAFSLARKQLPTLRLVCYGKDYESGGVAHHWAIKNKVANGVDFIGPVSHDEIVLALARAQVLVHPSIWEACCMAIAEAMAVGTPVIAGKFTGGVSWQLADGAAGVLINATDPIEIAESIIRLATNADVWERLSSHSQIRAKELFSAKTVAEQYIAAYCDAMHVQNVYTQTVILD